MTKTAIRKPDSGDTGAFAQAEAPLNAPEEGSLRRCIVSGKSYPKEELLRFCVSPSGELVADFGCKLPGRGIWVRCDIEVLRTAMTKGLFAKAAGGKVTYPDDFAERVDGLFIRRCCDLLGVAKKAGLVVSGFDKVSEALRKGKLAWLLEAEDGSSDGREKLLRLSKGLPVLRFLTSDETAHALGRELSIHTGLNPGGATDNFIAEAKRCMAFDRMTYV